MALRVLDAVDPLVTVEATTSVDAPLAKVQRGEDPCWSELRQIFGSDDAPSAQAADALPAQSG